MAGVLGRAAGNKGAADFIKLSKALKAAGEKGLRNELNKVMRDAAKPMIPKVREAAGRIRGRGGVGQHYAKKTYRAQTRTGANSAGVSIVGTKTDPRVDQQGRVAHPVFGRPKSTVVQSIPSARGFFSETLEGSGPQVRDEAVRALKDFADRIVREAR